MVTVSTNPGEHITRDNVDRLLDSGRLAVSVWVPSARGHVRWWIARRNGETRRWKRDPKRIRIPFKAGMHVYGAIETGDFDPHGNLNPEYFRVVQEAL